MSNDFSFSQFKIIFQQFKSWINENYVNDKQEVVKMQLTQTNHKTWKTQTFVDQLGLIVPQGKEGYFTDKECATLFQDLLKIKQRNGLLTHYLLRQKDDSSMETISYNAYVKFRCPDGSPDHTRVVDLFHIRYKIIRLEQNKSNLPLLFLFKPYCGTRQCQFCKDKHQFKIYQSSFYAIRSKFLLLLQQKISFMLRYKTYYFIPHSHIQPNDCGNAPYQHVKDINNNKITLYFEKSETVIVNALRAQALRRGIDCQFIRGSQFQKSELDFIMRDKQKDMQKLKYMCGLRGKNKPNHVWTTFDFLLLTTSYYHLRKPLKAQQEETFDTSSSKQYIQMLIPSEKEYSIQDILPKDTKNQNKQFQNRRLNRSIQSQVEKYQLIESEISKIARWHQQISKYKHPFILTIDIQIPKMQCATCKVMKEGLAFLTNLIDYINSFLMIEVLSKVEELSKEIQNKK